MDRLIEVKVGGSHLWKDSNLAGVQYEANITHLRISFDEGWDGYAKTITFFNAKGRNPVKRTLTADLLENLNESIRIYICPIPGEAMTEAGDMSFVIDGYIDETRQRTVEDTLKVLPARDTGGAEDPVPPTPSQYEQLQSQIDRILDDMKGESSKAEDAADKAEQSLQQVTNLALNPPTVGANGNWWVWDGENGAYVDSGVKAEAISGVYVGNGEMPDGYNVQVDPEGNGMTLEDMIREVMGGTASAKISDVTLPASAWAGSGSVWSQVVSIDGVTDRSQVDLTPSVEQLVVFYEKDLTFVTENENGVVTVYAIGQKPTNDYTIQVTITEVSV